MLALYWGKPKFNDYAYPYAYDAAYDDCVADMPIDASHTSCMWMP